MKRLIIPILMIILATTVMAQGIDSNTVLMLHADGDESASEHTYTAYGNPQLVSSGKFDGAMDFDGTGDYLSVADSSDWDFGSDDFTIDWWEYRTGSAIDSVIQRKEGTGSSLIWSVYGTGSGSLSFYMSSTGSSWDISNGVTFGSYDIGVWNHFAVARSGNSFYTFKNGVIQSTWTSELATNPTSGNLQIGRHGTTYFYEGYIDELRVSKGLARWTTGFTPDTSPHAVDADTNLLLHFEGDESDSGHNITFNGDADVSASDYKFDGSYHFDGADDYLSIPDSNDWAFGTGNFTIDFWMKPASFANYQMIMGQTTGDSYTPFAAQIETDQDLTFYASSVGSSWDIASGIQIADLTLNTWTHIAIVRNGNSLICYQDGISKSVTDISGKTFMDNSNPLVWGSRSSTSAQDYSGYLDEVRISKGIVRWTSAFTPDTVPYNVSSAVDPTYTEFSGDGDTTDFSAVDISAVDDPVLANSYAKVEWKGTFDLDGADLDSAVQFNSNFVRVDSAALAALNTVANITMKGTSYDSVDTYYILKDGAACGDCIKYSSNPVKFEVTGFSNYTTEGNSTGIPEFSTMTLGLGLIAVLVGLVLIRRKK